MITWDETKRQINLDIHGVDFADLEFFFDSDLLTREDVREAYGEPRFQSVGVIKVGLSLSLLARRADTQGRVAVATRCANSDSRGCV